MKKLLTVFIALSFSVNSFATECSAPVKLIEENSPAPCRGYLFSPDKELEVRVKVLDYSLLKRNLEDLNKIVDKLNKKEIEYNELLELERKKSDLWKTRAEDITLKYVTLEDNKYRRDYMFILMGIGLTVLAGWTVGQVSSGR